MCEMAAIGIDYTRSGAKGHSNHAASGFIKSHPGTIVTGQDQGCVWEDFMCIYVISMLYPCWKINAYEFFATCFLLQNSNCCMFFIKYLRND